MNHRESRKNVLMSIEATDGASDAAAAVGLHVATGPRGRVSGDVFRQMFMTIRINSHLAAANGGLRCDCLLIVMCSLTSCAERIG